MKIKDLYNGESIKDGFYAAVAIAALAQNKYKDDLLFAGVDKDKDSRARAYDEKTGQRGFFNTKTEEFASKMFNDNRNKLVALLGEYLGYASNETPTFKQGDKEAMKIDAWEIKISKKSKKILSRDLYLKIALLPSNNGVTDDYCFLIDFHD